MEKDRKLFDDFARMASGATGTLFDMKREAEAMIAAQVEKLLHRTHFVTRDEFETVRLMAQKAREENDDLKRRLEALEQAGK